MYTCVYICVCVCVDIYIYEYMYMSMSMILYVCVYSFWRLGMQPNNDTGNIQIDAKKMQSVQLEMLCSIHL